jgi:hypothetical protein
VLRRSLETARRKKAKPGPVQVITLNGAIEP